MMATEATTGRPVDDIVTPDSEPSIKINDAAQHVDANAPSVNGAVSPDEVQNKILTDIVDDLVNSADPSVSGGSDTETSRPDALKSKDGDKGHLRTSSAVKKPATFKSVSVNKTFLAAKGAATAAQTKLNDKPAPTTGLSATTTATASSSARPRLVAKSGGLVARTGNASGPAAAPDPSAVWNKNRPVPPPEPKKFTDEELKKHGIHMATRLQSSDAPPGQSSWADIDDDDEWVPEEIRWTDGTKSTIHGDEPVMPPPVAAPPMPNLPAEVKMVEKPRSPAPVPTTASAPIPAPAPVTSAVLASGRGLVLKGAPEKPTLVAKPPAPPTPVKSPWATLPPVDKAPPVVMDIPTSMPPQRFQHRGPEMPQGPTPPPYKEIAADDFSRSSFRDGPSHSNRELFNSQSGRYEPVMDRRGGPRPDPYMKQPPASLLQRGNQSDHPEPSAAFQTHRTSNQEGPYGRRRGSSNVSGGSSGLLAARMGRSHDPSMPGPPPEMLNTRRGSLTAVSDSPSSPRNYSPSGHRGPQGQQPWQPRPSPGMSHASPYHAAGQPDLRQYPQVQQQGMGVNAENELDLQKRIMQEGREAARQRRLEEEARLEAEKKERIRLKLEALGPAPERKSAKNLAAPVDDPTTIAPTHNSPLPIVNQQPPVADQKATQTSSAESKNQILPNGQPSQTPPFIQQSNADHTLPGQDRQQPESQSLHQPNSQSHAWQAGATSSDRLQSWGSSAQSNSRNVWGAPTSNNNRILGNGTFSSGLPQAAADSYNTEANMLSPKPAPGPIGPPKGVRAANLQPIGPPKSAAAAAVDGAAKRNAWVSAVKSRDDNITDENRDKRLNKERDLASRGLTLQDASASVRHSWKPTVLNDDGRRVENATRPVTQHKSSGLNDGKDNQTTEAAPQPQPAAVQAPARSSRFFPAQDVRKEEAAMAELNRSHSPSPPPPDMAGHPAFDGDIAHPHVSLPPNKIVVRLPPKDQTAAEHPATQAGRRPSNTMGTTQPTASAPSNWKSKIKDLLKGDKPAASVPRTMPNVMNMDSLSASFSGLQRNLNNGLDGSVTTKVPSEDCFGEQEMGSLPTVSVPRKDLYQDYEVVPQPKYNPQHRQLYSIKPNSIDVRGSMRDLFGDNRIAPIRFQGMADAKQVNLPGRTRSNPRPRQWNRTRGGRPAPGTGSQSSTAGPSTNNSDSGHGRGGDSGRGRGGYRGRNRSENWTRQPAAPVQT